MTRPISMRPHRSGLVDLGFGLDDVDEMGWMYTLLPLPPEATKTDRLKLALRQKLGKPDKYKWHFIRVSIRSGVPMLYVQENEDPDEPPLYVYDLTHVVNVHRYAVKPESKLKFTKFTAENDAYSETVYGQIGLAVELRVPASDAEPEHVEMIRLALSSTEDRDAWVTWFSEIVVLREFAEIEAAVGSRDKEREEVQLISPRLLTSTVKGKAAVRDYTRVFLQGAVGLTKDGGSGGLPNKGRLLVRPPEAPSFSLYALTGNPTTGEIQLSAKKKKLSAISKGHSPLLRFILNDSAVIVAPLPWSGEFQITISDTKVWQFQAENVESRNTFVTYLRTVKGRGRLAQTDQLTFPYMASELAKNADDDEQIRQMFLNGNARFNAKRLVPNSDGGSSDGRKSKGSDSEGLDGESDLEGSDEDAHSAASRSSEVSPKAKPKPKEKSEDDISDRDSPPLYSIASVDSVRPFRPWPTFHAEVVLAYLDETAAPHLLGRGEKAIPTLNTKLVLLTAQSHTGAGRGAFAPHSALQNRAHMSYAAAASLSDRGRSGSASPRRISSSSPKRRAMLEYGAATDILRETAHARSSTVVADRSLAPPLVERRALAASAILNSSKTGPVKSRRKTSPSSSQGAASKPKHLDVSLSKLGGQLPLDVDGSTTLGASSTSHRRRGQVVQATVPRHQFSQHGSLRVIAPATPIAEVRASEGALKVMAFNAAKAR